MRRTSPFIWLVEPNCKLEFERFGSHLGRLVPRVIFHGVFRSVIHSVFHN